MPPSEAQRRSNQKQDATRKRVALWLAPEDVKGLDRLMRRWHMPSRIATLREMFEVVIDG